MPEVLKYENTKTGQRIVFSWAGPGKPTQKDIKAAAERLKPRPFEPEPKRPFFARMADVAFAPSEYVAPKQMPQEEVEQLPLSTRLGRLGRETAAGLLSPEILATQYLT